MTRNETYLYSALCTAIRYIPESSPDAKCHAGICDESHCLRCGDARSIYAAFRLIQNQLEQDIIKAELS